MRHDIYEYLQQLGWQFSHETEDGRRIWSQEIFSRNGASVRFDEEEHLVELAMEAKG